MARDDEPKPVPEAFPTTFDRVTFMTFAVVALIATFAIGWIGPAHAFELIIGAF